MGDRKPYPSDVTDERWALIGPFLRAWTARRVSVSGHLGDYDLREIVNAILYQNRTGCQWAYLPHDLPPKSATYYYFARPNADMPCSAGSACGPRRRLNSALSGSRPSRWRALTAAETPGCAIGGYGYRVEAAGTAPALEW
ncbi:hypothetical protein B0E53_01659 [Micromonospora sp. MH33]|nr:transposase [Micromonospora sp. MH33]PSK66410.1 hypothetical protein B0E53_01659 [Micromonospora sp. MH33]